MQGNTSYGNSRLLLQTKVVSILERLIKKRSIDCGADAQLGELHVACVTLLISLLEGSSAENCRIMLRTLDIGTIRILQADDAQFIQNFLTVIGLLFSILAGNAYSALYQQQESIYFALFQEVSEAKSLLEQTTLLLLQVWDPPLPRDESNLSSLPLRKIVD